MSRFLTLALLAFCFVSAVAAEEVDYLSQIKPLLTEKCYSCHGVLKQESSLRLETRDLILAGGDGGEVIVPGDPEASPIIERIRSTDSDRMPPQEQGSALTADQVSLLENWIRQGANAPAEAIPTSPEQHWAFQPIVRPPMPERPPKPGGVVASNPIDALLEAKHASRSLRAQGQAERSLQLRRLYLDLLGLPPTSAQLSDARPWAEIVDELLNDPHHGERWARHWMDIWRYSDWYGLGDQLRNSQKHLWHWRDWIIDAVNRDKGYDRMILEMIAGDELAPDDPSVLAATGFLARNYYLFNRTTWLDNTIEHTSKAFLGLTINCAKCHDHKYDPITQLDYYRLRAIFEPHQVRLDPVPGVIDLEADGLPRVFDDDVDIPTYLHVRGDPKNPDTDREISAGVPELLQSFAPAIEPVPLPASAYAPSVRDYVRRDQLRHAESEVRVAEQQLAEAKQALSESPPASTQPAIAAVVEADAFEVFDDFDGSNSDLWKIIGDGWEYRDGTLHQTTATRQSQMARLLRKVPRDFELSCRFTTTGGTTYKSVTIRFDQSEDEQYSNYVYTSAHAPGPKVQVAFSRDGQSTYPAEGRHGHKIKVGQQYHLRFAVRDTLVNVWLDDEFLLACRYPDRRDGFLSLSGFDATVAFDSIRLNSLRPETEMQEAASGSTPSDPKATVSIAEAKLKAAAAKLRSLEATFAADQAKYLGADSGETTRLAQAAAKLQADWQLATAQYRLLADGADNKKREAAQQQIASAKEKLLAIEKGECDYESFRATRKALESPADKESDYPPAYAATSTGRRLALARWLTSPDNPLTAPRGGQPRLAAALWNAAGRIRVRFRFACPASGASRRAGFAGC